MIARHFLRIQRGALIGWSAVMLLIAFATGTAASVVKDAAGLQALLTALPPALQKLAGSDLIAHNAVDGYLAMKWFLLLPVVLGIFGVLTAATIVARENERGTIGYLLTLPVERGRLLRVRFLTLTAALAWLYLLNGVGIWLGLQTTGLTGTPSRWALLFLGFFAINLAMAGIALLLSLYLPSWGRAVQAGAGLVVGLYLIDTGLMMGNVADGWRAPFLYSLADTRTALLDGRLPWPAIVVGLAVTLLTLYLAERRFARQQITA